MIGAGIIELDFASDEPLAGRAALGLIVLQADETIEGEFRSLLPAQATALYHARIPSAPEVTPATLAKMEADLPATARLLPIAVDFAAIGYACTSASTLIGEEQVRHLIAASHPTAAVTNPLTAAKAAFHALGATRIGFVTPYVLDVTQAMRTALERDGFAVSAVGSFLQREERTVVRISPASVLRAMLQVGGSADCDAVFVSCTNLRTADILTEAESRLGKPVIASNQALAWHLMRLAGIDDRVDGYGRLMRQPLHRDRLD